MSESFALTITRFATAVASVYAVKGGFDSDRNSIHSAAVAAQMEAEQDASWSEALLDALERGGGRLPPEDYKKLFFIVACDPRNEALQLLQYEQTYIHRYRRAESLLAAICEGIQRNYEKMAAMMFSGGPFEPAHVKRYQDDIGEKNEELMSRIVASALYLSADLLTEENLLPLVDSCL